ncbi:MAG: inositol monophosphatase family protein [Rickettsiales endosymbiont of Dermacentor nuttalli]
MYNNYSANINVMIGAVRKASRRLVRDFGEISKLQTSKKGTENFASITALNLEKIIIEELKKARPSYNIILNNRRIINDEKTEFQWVINAIDGKENFLRASPFFCIALALEKTSNDSVETIASVIEVPILGETYWAEKKQGAWLENHLGTTIGRHKLRVSNKESLDSSILATSMVEKFISNKASDFIAHNLLVRVTGSSVLNLAYIASGRYDIIVESQDLSCIQAGSLLVGEAGGECFKLKHNVIATNRILYKNFESIIVK